MSKVRLYGDTSGYVDLKAPDVANDVTITLPNTTGPFATETYVDAEVLAGRGLVAVKSALFTGTQTASLAAGANVAVTDLSITHEVADAANKLIITAVLGQAANSHGFNNTGLAVAEDGALLAIGDAAGSRIRVGTGGRQTATTSTANAAQPVVCFVHTPGAGSKTYTVRAINVRTDTQTVYINRNQSDSDSQTYSRSVSSLVIQEVKV